jgi:hypothetical protein
MFAGAKKCDNSREKMKKEVIRMTVGANLGSQLNGDDSRAGFMVRQGTRGGCHSPCSRGPTNQVDDRVVEYNTQYYRRREWRYIVWSRTWTMSLAL